MAVGRFLVWQLADFWCGSWLIFDVAVGGTVPMMAECCNDNVCIVRERLKRVFGEKFASERSMNPRFI